jgi:CubicO group peptidase (beta-lactamase class C family)
MFIASLALFAQLLVGVPVTKPNVEHTVRRNISQRAYSGAAIVVGNADSVTYSQGFGFTNWEKEEAISPDSSLYDLASLTKVIATTSAIMYLNDRGYINLNDRVVWFIPEFVGKYKYQVTIKQLLTHTSGMRAGMNLSRYATPKEAKEAVINSKLYCRPGVCYNYSDLGAILLGIIVERVMQQPLDRFVQDSIFIPMGMTHTTFNPSTQYCSNIVWTKTHNNECGLVNDGNSQALGGVAGHAGLFSTASDLAIFAKMMLNRGRIDSTQFFDSATVELFTTNVTSKRALGWEVFKKTNGKIVGHFGWTGTMMLLDMQNNIYVVVLTNRAINRDSHRSFTIENRIRDTVTIAFIPDFSLTKKSKKKRINPSLKPKAFELSSTLDGNN